MVRVRIWLFHAFFLALTVIAFRHFFIQADYLWTSEATRLSWNMRLRGMVCSYAIKVGDGDWSTLDVRDLSSWQQRELVDPFFLRAFVLQKECANSNQVFAKVKCRAIGHLPAPLIDSSVDLCRSDYNFLKHNEWINPYPGAPDLRYREWLQNPQRTLE